MPVFQYKALAPGGTVTEGQLEAGGRQEALRLLAARGLRPVRLAERNGPSGNGKPRPSPTGAAPTVETPNRFGLPGRRRVSSQALENFTRLLASLLAAGVPLSRALVILQKEAAHPVAKARWKEIHDRVVDGMSLADAMAQSPDTFPRVYVAMVEAGETGGFLDLVLAQIADFQAREKELRSKVLTAMFYPTILLSLALTVMVFLLVVIIPKFQLTFAGFGAKLPALTEALIAASHTMRSYGVFVALGLALAGYLAGNWLRSPAGRRVWERAILRLPAVGGLVAQYAMARFCRMLGTLLAAGVPLINALNVARRSLGNQILLDAVTHSIDLVKEGKPLGASLAEARSLFAGSTLEMIAVAEESGKLDQELVRIANVTEAELDRRLKTAVALAEPVMLFLIAGLIGVIFVGMALPIFTLQEYIR